MAKNCVVSGGMNPTYIDIFFHFTLILLENQYSFLWKNTSLVCFDYKITKGKASHSPLSLRIPDLQVTKIILVYPKLWTIAILVLSLLHAPHIALNLFALFLGLVLFIGSWLVFCNSPHIVMSLPANYWHMQQWLF